MSDISVERSSVSRGFASEPNKGYRCVTLRVWKKSLDGHGIPSSSTVSLYTGEHNVSNKFTGVLRRLAMAIVILERQKKNRLPRKGGQAKTIKIARGYTWKIALKNKQSSPKKMGLPWKMSKAWPSNAVNALRPILFVALHPLCFWRQVGWLCDAIMISVKLSWGNSVIKRARLARNHNLGLLPFAEKCASPKFQILWITLNN